MLLDPSPAVVNDYVNDDSEEFRCHHLAQLASDENTLSGEQSLASAPLVVLHNKNTRRKKLQHYLRDIKLLVRERNSHSSENCPTTKLSTFEALERVIEMLHSAQRVEDRHSSSLSNPLALMPLSEKQPSAEVNDCDGEKPSSPGANSAWSATAASSDSGAVSIQSPATIELQQSQPSPASLSGQFAAMSAVDAATGGSDSPMPATSTTLSSASSDEIGVASPADAATIAVSTTTATMGRRSLGTVVVSLPEGTVLSCQDQLIQHKHQHSSNANKLLQLSAIVSPGDSLLALLHGKGAQTLLLGAFSGHSRRRMYARLKCGPSGVVRACEFLCDFSVDPANVARRLASIQVFFVESAFSSCSNSHLHNQTQSQSNEQLTFTTRHNASCAVIYLDAASIPLLGHFPSEITGKSLFALVHPDDTELVKNAHRQLHDTCGGQIVCTPNLRLVTYGGGGGGSVAVSSEWSAFVNPWTRHIEMVVGRHSVVAGRRHEAAELSPKQSPQQPVATTKLDGLREHDAFVYGILSKPVPCVNTLQSCPLKSQCQFAANNMQQKRASMPNNVFPTSNSVNLAETTNHQAGGNVVDDEQSEITPSNQMPMFDNCNTLETQVPKLQENSSGSAEIYLSYNQINCLENVHRLLKSQTSTIDQEASSLQKVGAGNNWDSNNNTSVAQHQQKPQSPLLTRELLHEHNQRWETEYKNCWRRRLASKRFAAEQNSLCDDSAHSRSPPCKMQKRNSTSDRSAASINHCASASPPHHQQRLQQNATVFNTCAQFEAVPITNDPSLHRSASSTPLDHQQHKQWADLLNAVRINLNALLATEQAKDQTPPPVLFPHACAAGDVVQDFLRNSNGAGGQLDAFRTFLLLSQQLDVSANRR